MSSSTIVIKIAPSDCNCGGGGRGSEERRGGEEGGSRGWPGYLKKKKKRIRDRNYAHIKNTSKTDNITNPVNDSVSSSAVPRSSRYVTSQLEAPTLAVMPCEPSALH